MLRINLLPAELRRGQSAVEQFHKTPLMLIVVGLLIAGAVLLLLPIPFRQRQLHRLSMKVQALEAKKLQVERLERTLQQLRAEEAAIRGLKDRKGLVSKWMNTISDATPDGVWFTDLDFDIEKGLVIQGSAAGQSDPGMANVTRFVQELKADPDFAAAAKNLQIESIKRTMDREIEIVQFTVACTFVDEQKTP